MEFCNTLPLKITVVYLDNIPGVTMGMNPLDTWQGLSGTGFFEGFSSLSNLTTGVNCQG